ncbi:MAG: hypothetical protein P4L85_23830 [Paludisphaera borealis]|uniref:hypothetical protein n=1 Tax=Paludisphaera borealis TaxID=1387353 RepID=UPI0028461D57|nr:hypothetical protein [Paludisphaera borealis]MDR3622401.1 hypothetical protein [Paludisphaera borealis]
MRIRILSAAACLSLVLLGAGLAQQVGPGPVTKTEDRPNADPPSSDPARKPTPDDAPQLASLRSQLVRLRAEVELLELEHEADVDHLKAIATDVRNSNDLEKLKSIMSSFVPEFEKLNGSKIAPSVLKEQDAENLVNSSAARILREEYDKMKKEFLRTTAELNEKKLQLIDLEKRFRAVAGD